MSEKKEKYTAVVLAAGKGTRMGGRHRESERNRSSDPVRFPGFSASAMLSRQIHTVPFRLRIRKQFS